MSLEESERFKRTINPYKNRRIIVEATETRSEKIKKVGGNMLTGIKNTQEGLRKTFPGLADEKTRNKIFSVDPQVEKKAKKPIVIKYPWEDEWWMK